MKFIVYIFALTFFILSNSSFSKADCSVSEPSKFAYQALTTTQSTADLSSGCVQDNNRLVAQAGFSITIDSSTGDAACIPNNSGYPIIFCGPCSDCEIHKMAQPNKFKCAGICDVNPCHFWVN